MDELQSFKVFKGLQAPLYFKGFKGKYIYIGLISILGAFLVLGVAIALAGYLVGLLVGGALVFGLFFGLSRKQKYGLFDRKVERGIYINKPEYIFLNKLEVNLHEEIEQKEIESEEIDD